MSLTTQYIGIDPHSCIACWNCVDGCPQDVIGKVDFPGHSHSHIDHAGDCTGCKNCVNNCPAQAIKGIVEFENAGLERRSPRRRYPKWERMLVDLLN